ncbi:MAG: hypothetical protein ACKO47_01855 [Alphaproteobacteria bacterium]
MLYCLLDHTKEYLTFTPYDFYYRPLSDYYQLFQVVDGNSREFYLIKKDKYPQIPDIKFSESLAQSDYLNSTPLRIYSVSQSVEADLDQKKIIQLPLPENHDQFFYSIFKNLTFPEYTRLTWENPLLSYFSNSLSDLENQISQLKSSDDETKKAIKEQIYLKINSAVTCNDLNDFRKNLDESLKICQLYNSITKYISSLSYDQRQKKQILKIFNSLVQKSIKPVKTSAPNGSLEFVEISKRFMTNLTLAIETINPVKNSFKNLQSPNASSPQNQSYSSSFDENIWDIKTSKSSSKLKESNILERGNKVKPNETYEKYTSRNIDQHHQQQSQQPLTTIPHVKSFAELNEKDTKNLYFTFIEKALRDTKKIKHDFSFQDAILAIKIAKSFGGVSNKLNERGDGYDELKIADINQSGLLSTNTIDEDKFKALKKFSALYQKYAGEYFLSHRDKKTSARLTFFPQRFLKDLESPTAESIVRESLRNSYSSSITKSHV